MVANAKVPRLHRQTLIEMNLAAFTARRDAALDRVLAVLRREMIASNKEQRAELYTTCLALLDEAILATQRSQSEQETRLLHCLNLLHDTVAASLALVRHELTMTAEAEQFSTLLGPEIVAELRTTNDVFSSSEMSILDCIDDLLKVTVPIREQDTVERRKGFTEDDRRRFDLTAREYRKHYSQYKPRGKPSRKRER